MVNNRVIQNASSAMDLGLCVKQDLTWNKHITCVINRANMKLGLIKRILGYEFNSVVKKICYASLVWPLLEYGTKVIGILVIKNIFLIESVQCRATKYICDNFNLDYKKRLMESDILLLTFH